MELIPFRSYLMAWIINIASSINKGQFYQNTKIKQSSIDPMALLVYNDM